MSVKIPPQFEPTARHIRVIFNGEIVAESKRAMLLRESRFHLSYFFPEEDVNMDVLVPSDHIEVSRYKGQTQYWNFEVDGRVAENAAFAYPNVPMNDKWPDMRGYITFDWEAMDAWFEEDEQVYLHPRDPYHRVDTIHSSRHIRVEIDGVTVAETRNPVLLFETTFPTRYYIPLDDVNMEYFTPTDASSHCPYKGFASYWTATINGQSYENILWGYLDPIPELPKVRGTVSFYNEKVDIFVDGELESRPKTVFS